MSQQLAPGRVRVACRRTPRHQLACDAPVRSSYAAWEPGGGIPRQPFRLAPGRADEPSVYVVDLNLAGVRHVYGFVVDNDQVREEWLYAYPYGRRRTLFERNANGIRLGSMLPDYRSRTDMLEGLTRKNALLLSAAAHANRQEVFPVYEWFRNGLGVPSGEQYFWAHDSWVQALAKKLQKSEPEKRAVVELIRLADLGISSVDVEESDISAGSQGLGRDVVGERVQVQLDHHSWKFWRPVDGFLYLGAAGVSTLDPRST